MVGRHLDAPFISCFLAVPCPLLLPLLPLVSCLSCLFIQLSASLPAVMSPTSLRPPYPGNPPTSTICPAKPSICRSSDTFLSQSHASHHSLILILSYLSREFSYPNHTSAPAIDLRYVELVKITQFPPTIHIFDKINQISQIVCALCIHAHE